MLTEYLPCTRHFKAALLPRFYACCWRGAGGSGRLPKARTLGFQSQVALKPVVTGRSLQYPEAVDVESAAHASNPGSVTY